jgi:hypothetical protein
MLCAVNCADPESDGTQKNIMEANDEDAGPKQDDAKNTDPKDDPTDTDPKDDPTDTDTEPKETGTDPNTSNEQTDGGGKDSGTRDGTDWQPPTGKADAGVAQGDVIDGQKVVEVYDYGDCLEVELQREALFACSSEQLAVLDEEASYENDEGQLADAPDLVASDCNDLADLRRPALKRGLNQSLKQRYVNLLSDYCTPQRHYAYIEGGEWTDECSSWGWGADAGSVQSGDEEADDFAPEPPNEEASDYSTTNTQVADVDEADWVKNDGGTIYVMNDSQLLVFDAWPIEEMKEVARIELPAEPRRMFLQGDRLVVYLRDGVYYENEGECTYGYECRSGSEGGTTSVQVYDVSEPESPLLLKEYQFSGAYLASRRIGPSVYSVIHDEGVSAPPEADVYLDAEDPDALQQQFEQKGAAVDELIDGLASEYFLPWASQRQPGEEYESVTVCDEALASDASAGTSFVSVFGFDLETLGTPRRTLVASKPGFVYSSAEALYMAVDGVDGVDDGFSSPYSEDPQSEQSTIHKFALADARATYVGTSKIPGHVLNQFSMDEHDSVLRVATSNGWVPNPDVSSNVVTLGDVEGEFKVIGKLTGLAPTEDIRSVRFDGERGFIVTFKKTDPLFVIGLDEPAKPTVLGELKIPGFSTYMHLMDENHLLAVGFDADDQGDFAYFDGIQVQIFDVTDLADPKLQHKAVIGTRGSGSEALMDHLAFNYFPSRGVLALPATICQGGDNGNSGDMFEFSGLVVFDVSLENGITERGRLPFVTPKDVEQLGTPECFVWWSDSSSLVKRSIFMEDYAIGLSEDWLKASALDNLDSVLQSLPLSDGNNNDDDF